MKQLKRIESIIELAVIQTEANIEELGNDKIIAREYFLGRKAGLEYGLSLLKSYIKDNTPWEE